MILAVDPGGTTGVALHGGLPVTTWFFEIPGGHLGFVDWFHATSAPGGSYADHQLDIVCESFIPRPGALTHQPDASYIIGYLKMWAHRKGMSFKLQSPAQAKSFSTNAKLKAAGLYPIGMGHAQDAARHLLVYLVQAYPQGEVARKLSEGLNL